MVVCKNNECLYQHTRQSQNLYKGITTRHSKVQKRNSEMLKKEKFDQVGVSG